MITNLSIPVMMLACATAFVALDADAGSRLVVKWKDGLESPAAVAGNAQIGSTVRRNFKALGWQVVDLPPAMSVAEGIAAFRALDGVAGVETDSAINLEAPLPPPTNAPTQAALLKSSVIPNDPIYSSQWYLPHIGAPQAWSVTTGGTNVVVVIFDTGVDYTLPDLAPNMWRNPGESGLNPQGVNRATNGVDDDNNGYVDDVHGIDVLNESGDPMDAGYWNSPNVPASSPIYHGTFIAGVIGAVGNNGQGIVGVNWSARIMAIRVFGGDFADPVWERGFLSHHLAAWDYVLAMKERGVNIRVANHSYGGPVHSAAMRDAFALAGGQGILSVAIAHNSAHDNDLLSGAPGAFNTPSIINVAASDESDALASFSGFGASTVDLAAPGRGITSMVRGGTYATGNGTSFACPLVVGTAALLLSSRPNLTVDELKAAIFGSVERSPALVGKVVTHGRLNVARALECLADSNPPAIVITALPAGQRTATNANIHVAFNRAMNRLSVEAGFVIQPSVAGRFEWAGDHRSFVFQPTEPFDTATNFTVKISGTATDQSGAMLDGNFNRVREGSPTDDYVWTFRFPIPNDDLANAQPLAGLAGSILASNRYASIETLELFGVLFGDWRAYGSSVWYQWTAPADGWITFDLTTDTAFDSLLAAFTGDHKEPLVAVAANDNYGTNQGSRISFATFAGTNYSVVVAGKNSFVSTNSGNFSLRWHSTPPPKITSFSPASAFQGQSITLRGTDFTGAARVLFNGVPAEFAVSTSAALTDLQLTATVPEHATTGPITVETPHGDAITISNFVVIARPALTSRALPETGLIELSWPATTGFTLQRANSFSTTGWTTASVTSSGLTNGIRYVTVTNAMPTRFFRLYRP